MFTAHFYNHLPHTLILWGFLLHSHSTIRNISVIPRRRKDKTCGKDRFLCMIEIMTQRELHAIKECKKGNLESFGELYELYAKKIYDFLFYRTYQRDLSEDLASVAFMKALQNIHQFDTTKGSFSSWMYRIAHNAMIDHYRVQKPDVDIESCFEIGEVPLHEEALDAKEKLETVKEYMKTLTPEQQELIRLRVWDGCSYKEIGEIMKKSEGSCKVMFSRVIAQMRKDLPFALPVVLLVRMYTE